MSDSVDDRRFRTEQLLNSSKAHSLREQMQEFIAEHESETELKRLRDEVATGDDLSEFVVEGRDERV